MTCMHLSEQQWQQQWQQQGSSVPPPPRYATAFSSAAEELQAKSDAARELAMDETCSGATESP